MRNGICTNVMTTFFPFFLLDNNNREKEEERKYKYNKSMIVRERIITNVV